MANRSPSEYFVKFLISQGYEPNAILRMLEDYGLDGNSSSYIRRLEASMGDRPDPFEPTKLGDTPSRKWMREHGILNLWFPSEAVREAYTILSNAQLRSNVQQLLLSPLRVEEATKRLNEHHKVRLTVEGVEAFGHYFWKKSLLTMNEWIEYLDGRLDAYQSTTAMLASPDMAQALVPWTTGMGGPPTGLNTGTVSRRVRDVAFMKMLEIERMPATLAQSKMMKNYMDVIRAAESEMRQSDVALNDVLKTFEKFHMKKDDTVVPSIESVAGPNYTVPGETSHDHVMDDDLDMEDEVDG